MGPSAIAVPFGINKGATDVTRPTTTIASIRFTRQRETRVVMRQTGSARPSSAVRGQGPGAKGGPRRIKGGLKRSKGEKKDFGG